uniref:Uncharacterized protein n=1 Tax=Arundo donax TaxID=35708 RepID=A0A0A9HXG1_ARUDO
MAASSTSRAKTLALLRTCRRSGGSSPPLFCHASPAPVSRDTCSTSTGSGGTWIRRSWRSWRSTCPWTASTTRTSR